MLTTILVLLINAMEQNDDEIEGWLTWTSLTTM